LIQFPPSEIAPSVCGNVVEYVFCVPAFTVKTAALLVALPAELLTTTVNVDPLSDVAVAGVV